MRGVFSADGSVRVSTQQIESQADQRGQSQWNAGRFAALAVALMMLALVVPGCKKPAPAAPPPPPAQVTVHTVSRTTIPMVYEFVGQTKATKTVEVRARVQGFLQSRGFVEGGYVDEGQTLFEIDPRSFRADLEVARANVAIAQARLDNATRQVGRLQELTKQGAASPKELDDWQTEQLQARASLRLSEANRALSELNLSYATVLSPLRGRVGRAMKDEGALVDSGANSLLTTVTQTDPMYVLFSIPEREWLTWRHDVDTGVVRLPGPDARKVELVLLDGTVYPQRGEFDFFDTQVNSQTGSVLARGVFPNTIDPELKDDRLKPGQFVRARIVGWERPNSIVIPQRCVLQNPAGAVVMLVDDKGIAQIRPVRLGTWRGDGWLILDGLNPGDRVISDGFMRARPGNPVTIVPENSATPPASGSSAPKADAKPTSGSQGTGAAKDPSKESR